MRTTQGRCENKFGSRLYIAPTLQMHNFQYLFVHSFVSFSPIAIMKGKKGSDTLNFVRIPLRRTRLIFLESTCILERNRGLSRVYGYAREKSGPLKQVVYAMEGVVNIFVMPIYQKVEGKYFEIQQFADKKVGNVIYKLDNCVPQTLKSRTCEIYRATKSAPNVTRSVVTDVRQVGVVEKTKEMENTLYS